jgi:hypothetical protein
MRSDLASAKTIYVITSMQNDACASALRSCLEGIASIPKAATSPDIQFGDVFEVHHMLARLSFEVSMKHVTFFQNSMREPVSPAFEV